MANDGISLSVAPGQVHALLGENGAGKTTLMNVLYGLIQPDEGEILIDGKPARFHSPKDAIAAGIGMVHQHFMLVPVFTVAENVTLGIEQADRIGLLDRRRTRREVADLSHRYGLDVDPDALVENLPVGIQQRVEIVKALVRQANVLILDEPTAVLTPAETEELFRIVRQLRDGGTSVIFISHKLREVQAIADTITVLRRGAVVGERAPDRDGRRPRVAHGRQERAAAGQQDAGEARRHGPRRGRAHGGRRRRPGLGERVVLPGAVRGNPRHRRRAGQRADRAVRGADGAAAHSGRQHHAERPRPHPRDTPAAAAGGRRVRPRGSGPRTASSASSR